MPQTASCPDWLTPDRFDTVMLAFPDMYGRLLGKRFTLQHFLDQVVQHGTHVCSYLLTVDLAMEPLEGFALASWDRGFGDFHLVGDLNTLRPLPGQPGTAVLLGDLFHDSGWPVEESPRRVLAVQIERLAARAWSAVMGSELEFFLFGARYPQLHADRWRTPPRASDYLIDYHLLQPTRDEDVIRRLRNEVSAANIPIECSKGEWGLGQHEVNLQCAEALEMADRHVLYKLAAKEIAQQEGKSITFMAKWSAAEAGNSCHIHTSLADKYDGGNGFADGDEPSTVFHAFLGGLLRYGRELTYFFAPTVNSYKRFQSASWAPTRLVWARDNRTCGFRVVGHGPSLRIENRMPGGDANPYLAFAATLAAGLRGIEEGLDPGPAYVGDAYQDADLPQLPRSLDEAARLLAASDLAREAFGQQVVDYYVQTALVECEAHRNAVTDWERERYFEQL